MATTPGATFTDMTDTHVHLETEDDIASAFENFWKEQDAIDNGQTPSSQSDEGKKKKPEAEEVEGDDEEASDDEAHDDDEDGESPSEDDEGNDDEQQTEDDEGKDDDDKGDKKKFTDDDEVYTKIKVGDEEHEVAVKDLKRLYGQEAALTKKSMEVAEKAKVADANNAKAIAALDIMVKRAQEASNPYRDINWAQLMKDPSVSAEDVAALQAAAKVAFDNEAFLSGQLDAFMSHVKETQAAAHREAAAAAIKSLTTEDSPNFIKGWNDKLYGEIRSFAVSQGIDKNAINALTDPAAFKIMHMAMQFHKGSQKVVVTKKVNKSPKKIVKSSTSNAGADSKTTKVITRRDAIAKQKRAGGDMDATTDAFAAILGVS